MAEPGRTLSASVIVLEEPLSRVRRNYIREYAFAEALLTVPDAFSPFLPYLCKYFRDRISRTALKQANFLRAVVN